MLWVYAKELWGATFEIPSDQRARDVKLRVWLDVLGDLDAALVRRTMVSLRSHFAPTPQELRDAALDLARAEAGERPAPDADEALAELHRLISHFGYMRPEKAAEAAQSFHPALGAVIRALGWQAVCEDTSEAVLRGQFRTLYEQAKSRVVRAEQTPAPVLAAVASFAAQLGAGDE
jgi:hypothetical protein